MTTTEQLVARLKKAVKKGRLSLAYGQREWYGLKIDISPLFCSYGQIGYEIYVYGYGTICYDAELGRVYEEED